MKRIAILGGTFNPIHHAHLAMADASMKTMMLDEIWFMPSKHPPHKSEKQMASEEQRCEMIKLAIRNKPAYLLSEFELKYEGTTYTAQTLQRLRQAYPMVRFYFIMGGDSFFQLESWYHPDKIMQMASILAIARDGALPQQMEEHAIYLAEKFKADIQIIKMPEMDISSSMIRERMGQGASIHGLLPEQVEEYIMQQHLYRT